MGTLSAKMTLKDGYGFGGFSLAPPSKQHLSTPPPPRDYTDIMDMHIIVDTKTRDEKYCFVSVICGQRLRARARTKLAANMGCAASNRGMTNRRSCASASTNPTSSMKPVPPRRRPRLRPR